MHDSSSRRYSLRLKGYDYSQAGAYFVTICAQGKECIFGEVSNGVMMPNDAGRMVLDTLALLTGASAPTSTPNLVNVNPTPTP